VIIFISILESKHQLVVVTDFANASLVLN